MTISVDGITQEESYSYVNNKIDFLNSLDKPVLISYEQYSHDGWNTLDHVGVFLERLSKLKGLIPDAKIIFLDRDPIDYIVSEWRSSYQQRYCQEINHFVLSYDEVQSLKKIRFIEPNINPYLRTLPRQWLYPYGINFNQYRSLYQDAFGVENCLFSNIQCIAKDRKEFLNNLFNFMGVEFENNIDSHDHRINRATSLSANISIKDGAQRLMGIIDKICKNINLYVPHSYPEDINDISINKFRLPMPRFLRKRFNWQYLRLVLSNTDHPISILANNFLTPKDAPSPRAELLKKFKDLESHYHHLLKH